LYPGHNATHKNNIGGFASGNVKIRVHHPPSPPPRSYRREAPKPSFLSLPFSSRWISVSKV
jgi:hypothetical protein